MPALRDDHIYWPFHPWRPIDFQAGVIAEGDYVRMVGSLWENNPHEFGKCWDGAEEGGHGWYELHPVDFMARFNDFAPNPSINTGQIIAACSAGKVDVDLRPPGPRPSGMVARYEEVVRVCENTTRSVTTRSDRITVHLDVGDRFWAYYRVYWGVPPPSASPPECPSGKNAVERRMASVRSAFQQMSHARDLSHIAFAGREKNSALEVSLLFEAFSHARL